MRKFLFNSFLMLILLASCSQKNELILKGKLGNSLNSEFQLSSSGDKFSGYFFYTRQPNEQIEIRGVKLNQILRLEEFNHQDDKLTGIFEGEFDGQSYSGYWSDPTGKQKVPFHYSREITDKRIVAKNGRIPKAIQNSYKAWVDEAVASGEFWYMSTRDAYHKKYWEGPLPDGMEYGDDCLDGLPEEFSDPHFGDINQDGKVDCYGRIFPFYCQPGTWQVNADMHLFFFSQPDDTYQAFVQPWDEISSKIGPAGSLDTIMPDGTLRYTGVDYGPNDANCCPSKEWNIDFRYVNGHFIRQ